jgi:uncharacterized membrane protein YkoI
MNKIIIPALLLISLSTPALSKDLDCSIHPAKNTPESGLAGMAKISKPDAEKAAIASLNGTAGTVKESELEVEDNCLIYSFDIETPGGTGVEEIFVDAGTGKVLSNKHESGIKEKAEKVIDKLTPNKSK